MNDGICNALFSAIIIVCIVGNKLSARIGVPSLLIFLALGMICGSDGILKIPFDNYQLSEQVCTVCLIFIMFCGGFSANWKAAKPVALRAGLLSSLGTIVTALITTAGCHFLIGFDIKRAFLSVRLFRLPMRHRCSRYFVRSS